LTRTERVLLIAVAFLAVILIGALVEIDYLSDELAVINESLLSQAYRIEYLNRVNAELQELVNMTGGGLGVQRLAPDTLNLVDNALLGVGFIINNLGSQGPYWGAHLLSPTPYLELTTYVDWGGFDMPIELSVSNSLLALMLQRHMLGGSYGEETENAYKNLVFDSVERLGALGFANTAGGEGFHLLVAWYALTEDEGIREIIESAVHDLENSVILQHDSELNHDYVTIGGTDPVAQWAASGAFTQIEPLVRWYEISGDESALNLAGNMTNWFLYHSSFVNYDGSFDMSEEGKGVFADHVYHRMAATAGVIKYGIATGKRDLVEWGKRIFDYVWSFSGGIGFIPERLKQPYGSETCAIRAAVVSAILLAKSGYPEYWNIVERMARNHMVQNQLKDVSWIAQPAQEPIDTETRSYFNVADRMLGSWSGWSDPNDWVSVRTSGTDSSQTQNCCYRGGEMLYVVWHNIVTANETGVYVNLSLNRDSEWVLVRSYMPYEGKVEVLVHDASTLLVRVPDWAERAQVDVTVDGNPRTFEWSGEYVKLTGLGPDENVTVTYPLRELVETVPIGGAVDVTPPEYTLTWSGDTVVEISPEGTVCPLYQREYFRQEEAPMKMTTFYYPEEELSFP